MHACMHAEITQVHVNVLNLMVHRCMSTLLFLRGQKWLTKPRIAQTAPKSVRNNLWALPSKQGFWGKSRQKTHPKVKQDLSSLWCLLCPWVPGQARSPQRHAHRRALTWQHSHGVVRMQNPNCSPRQAPQTCRGRGNNQLNSWWHKMARLEPLFDPKISPEKVYEDHFCVHSPTNTSSGGTKVGVLGGEQQAYSEKWCACSVP